MSHFLAELEIDSAVDEFLRARGVGNPQPIITVLDSMPPSEDEPAEDPDWDELTARIAAEAPAQTFTERILEKV